MYKIKFATKLKPKDHTKFSSLYRGDSKIKGELFIEAFSQFKQKYGRKNYYQLKYAEIDRVRSKPFQITLYENIPNEIEQLAKKFEVSKSALVREILCEYLSSLKK